MASLLVIGHELIFGKRSFHCAVGKGGFSSHKMEGDGATPLGVFALRECWYRADRMAAPMTNLPLREIHDTDGWCDDPKSPAYNRHVTLPYSYAHDSYSHELLWREEEVYDLIVPLGYNDDPAIPGKGSAIFLHIAHADYRPTEGCVALASQDLLAILPYLSIKSHIEIRAH